MHTYNILSVFVLTSVLLLCYCEINPHLINFHTTEASMFGLSLSHLAHQAELIVEGKVLGKVESVTTEFYNNSVSVGKVIKGNHTGNMINILTRPSEFTSDGVVLSKGENVILFLYNEKMYGGYMVVGLYQGKFEIDPKGVVYGLEINNMSVPETEKKIADLLSKPVNDTIIHNATEEAMYDDLPFSDTVFNGSTN